MYAAINAVISQLIMLNINPNRNNQLYRFASLMHTYEDRGMHVIFLVEEKTFSMKQAVTNTYNWVWFYEKSNTLNFMQISTT